MFYIHWQLAVRIYGINKYDDDDDDRDINKLRFPRTNLLHKTAWPKNWLGLFYVLFYINIQMAFQSLWRLPWDIK
jgi:hypothetical protein